MPARMSDLDLLRGPTGAAHHPDGSVAGARRRGVIVLEHCLLRRCLGPAEAGR